MVDLMKTVATFAAVVIVFLAAGVFAGSITEWLGFSR